MHMTLCQSSTTLQRRYYEITCVTDDHFVTQAIDRHYLDCTVWHVNARQRALGNMHEKIPLDTSTSRLTECSSDLENYSDVSQSRRLREHETAEYPDKGDDVVSGCNEKVGEYVFFHCLKIK